MESRQKSFYTTSSRLWWDEGESVEVAPNEGAQEPAGVEDYDWTSAFDSPTHDRARSLRRQEVPRRIHILGVGNVGLFVAHSLAGIPNRPPITLLAHRFGSLRSWREAGQRIEVVTDGVVEGRRGFHVEYVPPLTPGSIEAGYDYPITTKTRQESPTKNENPEYPASEIAADAQMGDYPERLATEDDQVIWNLIVSVKASVTVEAISKVAHRLRRDSSIMFLQNGMGTLDELNQQLFPDVETRPNYVVGVISHGIDRLKPYQVYHVGFGTIAVGILPRKPAENFLFPSSARYLLRTITRTPVLAAVPFSPTDLLQQQLDKLAVNCIINPLTAIFDCTNGELMNQFSVTRIMRLLLAEVSLVIRSLPELEGVPNKNLRYDPGRLEAMVVIVAKRTANNVSSTLRDVRRRSITEIDYINGYIVRRGEEMGIKCVLNYMLLHMVKAKSNIAGKAEEDKLPLDLQDTLLAHSEIPKQPSAPRP